MMKFKYIDIDGPEQTECYGVKFVRGVPSEVTDSFAIGKLSRNRYFEAVPEVETVVEVKAEAKEAPKRGRPAKARYA
jgi:hypothetical protein